MLKHIILMALFQGIALFSAVWLGEFFIIEPKKELRYDLPDGCCVFPGRKVDWNGDPLYSAIQEETGEEDSRHMTWVFDFYVFLQIWNMVCARKIHDEWNVFEDIHKNVPFLIVWLFIVFG